VTTKAKAKKFTGCAYCRKAVLTRNQECASSENPTGICESLHASKPPAYKSPEYMRQLGQRGGRKNAKKKGYFSRIAKLSHKVNNPDANRDGYNGGRRSQ